MVAKKKKCKDCDKTIFWVFIVAMRFALNVKRKDNIEMRVYRCPHGRGYHMSTRPNWREINDGRTN